MNRGQTSTQTGQVIFYVLAAAFVLGIVGGVLLAGGGRSLARQLDQEQRALYLVQQAALQPWKIAGGVVVRAVGMVLVLGAGAGIVYAGWIGLNFLDRRARLVYPRDGLFPIVEARGDITIYDPNRNAAGAKS